MTSDSLSDALKRIAALTDREFWQGAEYLGIPLDQAERIKKDAERKASDEE